MPLTHTIFRLLLGGIWLGFCGWTLYRLGSSKFQSDEFVSRVGVKQFGVTGWIAATSIGSYASFEDNPSRPLIFYFAIYAFFLLPVCLWMGFVWGKGMAALFPNVRKK